MSLLDDVSIVVTPNGYKAGELYAVVPVPTEGTEILSQPVDLVTDFTAVNGASIVDVNTFTTTGGSVEGMTKASIFTAGKRYKLIIEGTTTSSGFALGNTTAGGNEYGTGFGTHIFTASGNATLWIRQSTAGTTDITSFTIKEYTSADMDVTRATAATRVDENGLVNYAEVIGGEEIDNGEFTTNLNYWSTSSWWVWNSLGAYHPSTSLHKPLYQQCCVIGKTYLITFDLNVVQGGAKISLGTSSGGTTQVFATNLGTGSYSYYVTASAEYLIFNRHNTGINNEYYVNNVSVKEVTRDNVPRIDYTGGGCPHILAEPMRTNLIQYSEDFSQWIASGSMTVGNSSSVASPSNENSVGIMTGTTGTVSKFARIDVTTTSQTHTYSAFFKYNTQQFVQFASGGTSEYANFDIQNGVVGNKLSSVTSTIESFGNGWYRCTLSTSVASQPSNMAAVLIDSATSARLSSTSSTNSLYIWGASLEEGSYSTSYIPNFGTALGVTRNQDIFTRDGIGSLINSTEGVLFLEVASFVKINPSGNITLTDGSGDNRIYIYYLVDNSISVIYNINSTGAAIHNFALADITQQTKIAVKWGDSNVSVWINGNSVLSTATSNFLPNTLNQLHFSKPSGGVPFEGKVKQLQVYNTALSPTQLAALTS